MEATLRSHLLTLVNDFVALHGSNRSAVSKVIFNDNTFFVRVAEGKNFTIKSYDRALAWFDLNWPKDRPWPLKVPRPDIADSEAA